MYDFTHNIRATVFYARNVNWDNLSHVPNGICDYLSHYMISGTIYHIFQMEYVIICPITYMIDIRLFSRLLG